MAENEKFLRSVLETFIYGAALSDKELSGYVAAFFRKTVEEAGKELARRYIERLSDQQSIGQLIGNFIKMLEEEGLILPGSMKVVEDSGDEVTVEMNGCSFASLCKRFNSEGLVDPRGVVPCIRALQLIGVIFTVRDEVIDWEFAEFNPPNCKFKLRKL